MTAFRLTAKINILAALHVIIVQGHILTVGCAVIIGLFGNADFKGIIDLVLMKAYIYTNDLGTDILEQDIPDDMKDDEYKGYIPCIMANLSDINSIRSAITKMLQAMGVEIDLASGIDWASDIDLVCNKIYHIGNKNI